MKKPLLMSVLVTALFLSAGFTLAADQAPEKAQAKEQVYGSQLMTRQERIEYRAKMRAAKTVEEREQIRNQHHESMKARASERGVTLPDVPPAMGAGMGPGAGMGGRGR